MKFLVWNGQFTLVEEKYASTDEDKVNIVVYRYRNNTYLKDTEVDLKLTEYKKLLVKRVCLLSYIDVFYKRCISWMKQLFIIKTNPVKNGCSLSI